MTYDAIITAKKDHETAAQIIRSAKFSAYCNRNNNNENPYEVRVKGATQNEISAMALMFGNMFKGRKINIVSAK